MKYPVSNSVWLHTDTADRDSILYVQISTDNHPLDQLRQDIFNFAQAPRKTKSFNVGGHNLIHTILRSTGVEQSGVEQ